MKDGWCGKEEVYYINFVQILTLMQDTYGSVNIHILVAIYEWLTYCPQWLV